LPIPQELVFQKNRQKQFYYFKQRKLKKLNSVFKLW
jgi:hypothetical protein